MNDVHVYLLVSGAGPIPAGVDAVQLRDKQSDDAAYADTARKLAEICRERGIPFLLNDRWHLVADTGADGVHLGQDDAPIEEVRASLGPDVILGLSTHDAEEAKAARGRGADYIGIGPMFPTQTKQLSYTPGGAALFARVKSATDLPIFAIGGINETNLEELLQAGARRIAVSAAILGAPDPAAAASRLAAMTRF